jgi:hypothetical protein
VINPGFAPPHPPTLTTKQQGHLLRANHRIVIENIPTMAAVAQQYYEEAAQNEQMGEEDEGVSKRFFLCVRIIMMRYPVGQCIRAESR